MKQITLFLGLALCSCTVTPATVKVDGIEATGSKNLGSDEMIYARKGNTEVAIASNNSRSFREGASVVKFGIGTWGLTDIWSTGASTYQSVKNSKTAAGITNTAAKEGTKQLGITEATKVKGLELEAAALGQ